MDFHPSRSPFPSLFTLFSPKGKSCCGAFVLVVNRFWRTNLFFLFLIVRSPKGLIELGYLSKLYFRIFDCQNARNFDRRNFSEMKIIYFYTRDDPRKISHFIRNSFRRYSLFFFSFLKCRPLYSTDRFLLSEIILLWSYFFYSYSYLLAPIVWAIIRFHIGVKSTKNLFCFFPRFVSGKRKPR